MKKVLLFIGLIILPIFGYAYNPYRYYRYYPTYSPVLSGYNSTYIKDTDTAKIHFFAMGMGAGTSTRQNLNGFQWDFFCKLKRFEMTGVIGKQKHKSHTCGHSDLTWYLGMGGYVADIKYWSCSIGGLLGAANIDLDRQVCRWGVHRPDELKYCPCVVEDSKSKFSGGIYVRNIVWLNPNSDRHKPRCGLYNTLGLLCYEGFYFTFGLLIGMDT